MRNAALLLAVSLIAAPVQAQSDSLLTAILSDPTPVTIAVPKAPVGAIRLASAAGGFVFGILVGGFAGSQMLMKDCTKCDKPQLDALVTGGAIGGAIGAGLGAAFLELGSVCSFDKRLLRSMLGSAIGASAMFVAAGGLDRGGRTVFFVPIGAVGGSLLATGRCWRSSHATQ
jgi:hypothetical protein